MDNSFTEKEVFLVITIGVIIMLFFAIAFVLFFYFSQRKFQSEQIQAKQRELTHQAALLTANIQTQEKERQRIARALHDDVGSKLNVLNLGIHRLRKNNASEELDDLLQVLGITIDTTRRISHELLPPTLENFGIKTAIEELCEQYGEVSGKEINFQYTGVNQEISSQIELVYFRIIQELMSNSFKHSEAKQIDIRLHIDPKTIRLEYQDNGNGFDLENSSVKKGLGLKNIESQAQVIQAQHFFKSKTNEGVFFEMTKSLA